jgi:hypothetical protein
MGVYLPSVVLVAELDPEPVAKGDCGGQGHGWEEGDGPWRREIEQVKNEDNGWNSVEADIWTRQSRLA